MGIINITSATHLEKSSSKKEMLTTPSFEFPLNSM